MFCMLTYNISVLFVIRRKEHYTPMFINVYFIIYIYIYIYIILHWDNKKIYLY